MEGVGSERQVEMPADIFMTFSFGIEPFLRRAIRTARGWPNLLLPESW